jgi:hypothetical protein
MLMISVNAIADEYDGGTMARRYGGTMARRYGGTMERRYGGTTITERGRPAVPQRRPTYRTGTRTAA